MATEEAAKVWKEELDKVCWEVECSVDQAEPGETVEHAITPPEGLCQIVDWIDYLKMLLFLADLNGLEIKLDQDDGRVFLCGRAPSREDDLDDLEDRRYEDAKDEALC